LNESLTSPAKRGRHPYSGQCSLRRLLSSALWVVGFIAASSVGAAPVESVSADVELEAVLMGASGSVLGDSLPFDQLGERVAIAGDTLLVAAPGDDVANFNGAGSVYVFQREGTDWLQKAKLVASNPQALARFGRALAWDGQHAVVGAADADGERGAVYVFERSGDSWVELALIQAPTVAGMQVRGFGEAVALSGDRILVGADRSAFASPSTIGGSAHSLVRSNGEWQLEATLTAPHGGEYRSFGATVALSGNHAIVGALASGADQNQGTAHAFQRDTAGQWSSTGTLVPMGGVPAQSHFASAIAMSADVAIVGAPRHGTAYLFARDGETWRADGLLAGQQGFGNAIALSGDRLLIGAHIDDAGAPDGIARLFERVNGNWIARATWTELVDGWLARFGAAVALDANTAVVGSPGGNAEVGGSRGQAKVFEQTGGQWSLREVVRVDPGPQGYFGGAVAIAGSTAMISSAGDDIAGRRSQGSVRWIEKDGMHWHERGRITASPGWAFQLFGSSLALDGDRLLVGATGLNAAGTMWERSAYQFARQGENWEQQSVLTLPPIDHDSRFGFNILLAGDIAIISASGQRVEASTIGAVHIFVDSVDGWSLQQTLTAPEPQTGGGFGESIALHQDLLMIGAPRLSHGHASNARGAVYLYRRTGSQWQFDARIDVPADESDASFGTALLLDEHFVYIGMPTYAGGLATTQRSGAVYVYPRVGQSLGEPSRVAPESERIEPRFGQTLTVHSGQLVVGAPFVIGSPVSGEGWDTSGTVFIFLRDDLGWRHSHRLTAPTSHPHVERFGERLTSDPTTLLIGAPNSGGPPPYGNPGEGAALIYGDGSGPFANGFEP